MGEKYIIGFYHFKHLLSNDHFVHQTYEIELAVAPALPVTGILVFGILYHVCLYCPLAIVDKRLHGHNVAEVVSEDNLSVTNCM